MVALPLTFAIEGVDPGVAWAFVERVTLLRRVPQTASRGSVCGDMRSVLQRVEAATADEDVREKLLDLAAMALDAVCDFAAAKNAPTQESSAPTEQLPPQAASAVWPLDVLPHELAWNSAALSCADAVQRLRNHADRLAGESGRAARRTLSIAAVDALLAASGVESWSPPAEDAAEQSATAYPVEGIRDWQIRSEARIEAVEENLGLLIHRLSQAADAIERTQRSADRLRRPQSPIDPAEADQAELRGLQRAVLSLAGRCKP